MDLWIRSQDKTTLIKSYEIYVSEYGKDSYVIRAKRTSHILGAYKTIERALEVLDEIQNLLKPQTVLSKVGKPIAETCDGTVYREPDEYDIKELSTYVYEMPEE